MLKVKILKPVDGYEIGDTPEMTGNRFRELEASGHVERARTGSGENPVAKPKGKRR
jgi:hypothetical protein